MKYLVMIDEDGDAIAVSENGQVLMYGDRVVLNPGEAATIDFQEIAIVADLDEALAAVMEKAPADDDDLDDYP